MVKIIIILFLMTIVGVIIKEVIHGINEDTFKLILKDIVAIRGFYFLVFYCLIVISMMNQIPDIDKLALLPFLLCGLFAMLTLYPKTKQIGVYGFVLVFSVSFLIMIIIGMINSPDLGIAEIIFALCFIAFTIFVIVSVFKKK